MNLSTIKNLSKGTWNSARTICKECEACKLFRGFKPPNVPKPEIFLMPKAKINAYSSQAMFPKIAKPFKTKRSLNVHQRCIAAFNPKEYGYLMHEQKPIVSEAKHDKRRKSVRPKIKPWKPPKRHNPPRRMKLSQKYSFDHLAEEEELHLKLKRRHFLDGKPAINPYNPWNLNPNVKVKSTPKDDSKRKYTLSMPKILPFKPSMRQNESQEPSQDQKYRTSFYDLAPKVDKKHLDELWPLKRPNMRYQPWNFNVDQKYTRNGMEHENKDNHRQKYNSTEQKLWKPQSSISAQQKNKYVSSVHKFSNPPSNTSMDQKNPVKMFWKTPSNVSIDQKNKVSSNDFNGPKSSGIPKILPWKLTRSHNMQVRRRVVGPLVMRPITPGKPISEDINFRRMALYKCPFRRSNQMTATQQIERFKQNLKNCESW